MKQNTYDQYADQYARGYAKEHQDQFNYNRDLVIPNLFSLVDVDNELTRDLTILDAGCGEGIVSRMLSEHITPNSAIVGIDVSPRLVETAVSRNTNPAITYEVHDLSQPLSQYASHFDLIVSNLVLNDVPHYEGFIATLGSVLKPNGRIVASMNNPYSAVFREKVDNYFDSHTSTLYGMAKEGVAVYYYHRTMEEYITAFHQNGLLLRRLVDMRMPEAMVAQLPERNKEFPWYDMYHRYPFMIVLELVKI
ncbi:MAG: class I SAM-dependent methyltransferase [Chloroflexota bacterium]